MCRNLNLLVYLSCLYYVYPKCWTVWGHILVLHRKPCICDHFWCVKRLCPTEKKHSNAKGFFEELGYVCTKWHTSLEYISFTIANFEKHFFFLWQKIKPMSTALLNTVNRLNLSMYVVFFPTYVYSVLNVSFISLIIWNTSLFSYSLKDYTLIIFFISERDYLVKALFSSVPWVFTMSLDFTPS